mmetsp:Transcript_15354/g.28381  ORF Transcript_15354/g.28381 Transcript_15354/m.28381 type:complete len:204 (+) Transcript_15354:874-1485(+)
MSLDVQSSEFIASKEISGGFGSHCSEIHHLTGSWSIPFWTNHSYKHGSICVMVIILTITLLYIIFQSFSLVHGLDLKIKIDNLHVRLQQMLSNAHNLLLALMLVCILNDALHWISDVHVRSIFQIIFIPVNNVKLVCIVFKSGLPQKALLSLHIIFNLCYVVNNSICFRYPMLQRIEFLLVTNIQKLKISNGSQKVFSALTYA